MNAQFRVAATVLALAAIGPITAIASDAVPVTADNFTRAVTTGVQLDHVDLSKVDQIGFIDLMPSSGHGPGGWSDVAQVEVYGKSLPR